jgi:hypothetical protein
MQARALQCVPWPNAAPAGLCEGVIMLFVTIPIASCGIGPEDKVRHGTPTLKVGAAGVERTTGL